MSDLGRVPARRKSIILFQHARIEREERRERSVQQPLVHGHARLRQMQELIEVYALPPEYRDRYVAR